MSYILILVTLWILEVLYFKIASKINILDRPNERSSHNTITIRGGGVIFVFSILIAAFIEPYYWLPALGALIIAVVSFLDDRINLSSRVRFIVHLIAVSVLFASLGLFHSASNLSIWIIPLLYILVIGTINAYNFMDGINGITGLYSLVILGGLQYVNLMQVPFIEPDQIWLPMIACCVFLFYNLRRKAKCFAGDVGSITIAYWISYLLLKVVLISEDFSYILFLMLYGVDTVLTILHRLFLKQNIFQAHRMHFYQVLVNEKGWSHLSVSVGYAIVQASIVVIILLPLPTLSALWLFIFIVLPLLATYCLKFYWVNRNLMSKD